ncbi:glycosyltransferase [Xenorhabdus bovienii]|uniref:glycosyltransferase n=1 Tax=Xenorhabdus bovienii TaxID=40576 RepID=UPI0023B2CD5D|nr:glycosyltransferase [Xenorhabdus bovienii]MDE9544018.1 glycosyltransferase [Xenorhabdus bovienii]
MKKLIKYIFSITCKFLILKKRNKEDNKKKHKVLVSYIIKPFLSQKSNTHSNLQEARCIIESISEMGYDIDICDYRNRRKLNYKKYHVIFGFGYHLEKAIKENTKCKIIHYATGMPQYFQNIASIKRIKDFKEKNDILALDSARLSFEQHILQEYLSDGIISIGGKDTHGKFKELNKNIIEIDTTYIDYGYREEILNSRNIEKNKKNFLWLGGPGAIHKGLDLLIELFSDDSQIEFNDAELHIVGNIENEPAFFDYMKEKIKVRENIFYYGYQNIESESMLSIFKKCVFAILPSCSEGQATSIINCVGNGGLIPIVSKNGGNDKDYTIYIEDLTIESIKKSMISVINLTNNEIKFKQDHAISSVIENNNLNKFKEKFKSAFRELTD